MHIKTYLVNTTKLSSKVINKTKLNKNYLQIICFIYLITLTITYNIIKFFCLLLYFFTLLKNKEYKKIKLFLISLFGIRIIFILFTLIISYLNMYIFYFLILLFMPILMLFLYTDFKNAIDNLYKSNAYVASYIITILLKINDYNKKKL